MKVNKVYAEEIAKWEGAKSWSGDKATKPFAVLWDDPESGADLKVVYRTPKEEGVSLLLLGFATCVVLAAITALLCRAFQPMCAILIGGPLILAFAVSVVVRAMRLGWVRMEYEFRRGICTVRYSMAEHWKREWSFPYNDRTRIFSRLPPFARGFVIPEYGFVDEAGSILFRTKQAMKLPHYDYFSLVVTGYLSRDEDEEKSARDIAEKYRECTLRDKSLSRKWWAFVVVSATIVIAMHFIDSCSKPTKEEERAQKEISEAFYNGGDYLAVAEAQKAKCGKRAQKGIDEVLDYCAELSAARQELQKSVGIEDADCRKEALQELASRLRERVKVMKAVRRRSAESYAFANSFESLAVTAEALISVPDCKMITTTKENMQTAASQQSTEEKK